MKKLFLITLASLLALANLTAQTQYSGELTAATPAEVSDDPVLATELTVINGNTAASVIKLYDTSEASTNIVRAAYSRFISYATNYNVLSTNQQGFVWTNTFAGTFTGPSAVSAVTNERPAVVTRTVPALTTRTYTINVSTLRGLAVVSSQNTNTVEITYTLK